MRDITAGSGSCVWRSLGELQVMNGLEGIAERTCEAFVVCAMEGIDTVSWVVIAED